MTSKEKTMEPIKSFRLQYRFLSNFWPAYVKLDEMWFDTVEHAYVASKTLNMDLRKEITKIERPGDVKRFGRTFKIRPAWEGIKYYIMLDLVRQKFRARPLQLELLATGDRDLIEGNNWHDKYWGVCYCDKCKGAGDNILGKILMQVRREIKDESRN